jgi:Fe2+ or Zn2+ uptake regulation protein
MLNKLLSWFGFCEHSYIVSSNWTGYHDIYTKKIKCGTVEFKSFHYIWHLTCFNCGKIKEVEIIVKDAGSASKHEDHLSTAKMRLSLKYRIRNKF